MKRILIALASVGAVTACSGKSGNLSLSVRAGPSAATAGSPAAAAPAVSVGSIRIAVRKVALEPAGDGKEVEIGPFGISVSGNSPIHQIFDASVPPGDYRELKVVINTVTAADAGSDATLQALAAIPASIAVDGTVAGASGGSFTFTTTMELDQERNGTFTVGSGAAATSNVTMDVDPSGWFVATDGSSLDPRDPANRGQILANIRASIRTFPDRHETGEDEDECECEDHDLGSTTGSTSGSMSGSSHDDGHHDEVCTCTPAPSPDGGTPTPDGGMPAPDGGTPR
jgi:hypothetical protein